MRHLRAILFALALGAIASVPPIVSYVSAQSVLGSGAGVSWRTDDVIIAKANPATDLRSGARKWFGVQVRGVGAAATSWTVELQVSLDGTNFVTLTTHSDSTDANGDILWISTPAPALWFRSEVTAVTLGSATALSTTIIGVD
jgi:hypothetical protein